MRSRPGIRQHVGRALSCAAFVLTCLVLFATPAQAHVGGHRPQVDSPAPRPSNEAVDPSAARGLTAVVAARADVSGDPCGEADDHAGEHRCCMGLHCSAGQAGLAAQPAEIGAVTATTSDLPPASGARGLASPPGDRPPRRC